MDNEDKQAWCDAGARAEEAFAGPLLPSGIGVLMNPAKRSDRFTHDLYAMVPCDLKTVRTRFNTAYLYGIEPRTAITINDKDVERYKRLYPHLLILFDIDYGDYKSRRIVSVREVVAMIARGRAKRHEYIHRVDDIKGNAKVSWVIDSTWLAEA